jgi:MFS family permease
MSESLFAAVACLLAAIGALRATWSPCGQSMLASLTPVGERSRGFSWRVTASAYALGAIGGGALTGVALGTVGSLLPGGLGWRGPALLGTLLAALVIDATPLRRRLLRARGQVNEDWMARYRGWVYGFGFGARLGVGFTTLVSCAAVYAAFAGELLSGSPAVGALIGVAFGAVKAIALLPARTGRDPHSLRALHRALARWDSPVAHAVVASELLLCAAVIGQLT